MVLGTVGDDCRCYMAVPGSLGLVVVVGHRIWARVSRAGSFSWKPRHSPLQGQLGPWLQWSEMWWGMVAGVKRLLSDLWDFSKCG